MNKSNLKLIQNNILTDNTGDISVNKSNGQANISIRGAERELGLSRDAIGKHFRGGDDNTSNLNETLVASGFVPADFAKSGIPILAFAEIASYYAMDARNPTDEAKILVKQFQKAGAVSWAWHKVGYVQEMTNPQSLSSSPLEALKYIVQTMEQAEQIQKQHSVDIEECKNDIDNLKYDYWYDAEDLMDKIVIRYDMRLSLMKINQALVGLGFLTKNDEGIYHLTNEGKQVGRVINDRYYHNFGKIRFEWK